MVGAKKLPELMSKLEGVGEVRPLTPNAISPDWAKAANAEKNKRQASRTAFFKTLPPKLENAAPDEPS